MFGADAPHDVALQMMLCPLQDTRFMVEEMPEILHEIAEEIRAEFPYELEPPSLDYAQVNVITIPEVPKVKVGRSPSSCGFVSCVDA